MYATEFADCCTARIIEDFGVNVTKEQLKEGLLWTCRALNEDEYWEDNEWCEPLGKFKDLRNLGLIFATTTTAQVIAADFLKSVGFKKCGSPAAKGRHSETRLQGWYIKANSLHRWYRNNKG